MTRLSIVVVASLGLAGCDMFGSASSSTAVSQTVAEGQKAVDDAASGVAESLGLTSPSGAARVEKPTPTPSAAPKPAPTASKPRARSTGTRPVSLVAHSSAVNAPLSSETSDRVYVSTPPIVAASNEADNVIETATTAAAPPVVLDARNPIYSKDDSDVLPARLITTKESGPLFRGVRPELNTMELIISQQGRVEQVRMMTPARTMTDMLLLSGAKTWKFTPALKEGQPVRYRAMFSWESTP
jgi:hypothetical protein